MDVKKIFIILISVVACLVIGAFVLNTIIPNAMATGINTIEGAIQNGTGINVDINGDGKGGKNGDKAVSKDGAGFIDDNGVGVGGAQGFGLQQNGNNGGN